MRATPPLRMTADEFLAWAMARPDAERYELVAGEVVAMSPKRAGHGRAKLVVVDRLREAVRTAVLPCEAFIDGMAVRIDDTTVYEPDVLLRYGAPVDDDCVEITDPVVVVEVLSPSSRRKNTGGRLEDCFHLPAVRRYLIVKTANRAVIHHRREVEVRVRGRWPKVTRRRFLAAAAAAALLPPPAPAGTGEPFSDGTWFADDGTGWVD